MPVLAKKSVRINSLRKTMLLLLLSLLVSGIALSLIKKTETPYAVLLFHIWGGLAFAVVFPLYAIGHIFQHRNRLHGFSWLAFSGILQAGTGLVLILSGFALIIYYDQHHPLLSLWHQLPSLLIVIALALHYISPKR